MDAFFQKIKMIWQDDNLRWRILFIVIILGLFRLGATIPLPAIDLAALDQFLNQNQFFGLLDIFAGGGLSNLSIMMLGVGPFITASIIMQLLTIMFPQLKQLYHEEGMMGRRKVAQYARYLTVPLALVQGFGLLMLLEREGVLLGLTMTDRIVSVIVVAAGSVLLMWMGELINEYGIGNGVSLIIFAGIVASLPQTAGELLMTFQIADLPTYIAFLGAAILIIGAVVVMTEGERPIPITYAKRVRGMKQYGGISTYLPVRVNNAGVMPIIFALAILLFPQMIINFLSGVNNEIVRTVIDGRFGLMAIIENPWIYSGIYFILVFGFTYFYSAVTFDPKSISTNLQKSGAFVPGVRPGHPTAVYLSKILTRLTLVGAIFLGVVALLPIAMQGITGNPAFAIGGTSLLIVVVVVLDLIKKIDAQITMREY